MKPAIPFFLSLCFLLLGGYNHLFAQLPQDSTSVSRVIVSANSDKTSPVIRKFTPVIIRTAAPSATDGNVMDATEMEDDDEFHVSRKYVAITNYFLSLFYAQVSGDVHRYHYNRLPFCKHFSYTASFKYIMQRVIRI